MANMYLNPLTRAEHIEIASLKTITYTYHKDLDDEKIQEHSTCSVAC